LEIPTGFNASLFDWNPYELNARVFLIGNSYGIKRESFLIGNPYGIKCESFLIGNSYGIKCESFLIGNPYGIKRESFLIGNPYGMKCGSLFDWKSLRHKKEDIHLRRQTNLPWQQTAKLCSNFPDHEVASMKQVVDYHKSNVVQYFHGKQWYEAYHGMDPHDGSLVVGSAQHVIKELILFIPQSPK
jgi:hypothetical protein